MNETLPPPHQPPTDINDLVAPTRELVLTGSTENTPKHVEFHQLDYLLKHTFYASELPKHYQKPLTPEHRLPLYCLGIPFLSDQELYECAKALPWEDLEGLFDMRFRPGYLERGPEECAIAIHRFFWGALGSKRSFHMYLKYCLVALDGIGKPLKKIPVLVYQDTHHVGSLPSAWIRKSNAIAVLDDHLLRDGVWTARGTFWMLGWDAVYDEDGNPLTDNQCPLCGCCS